MYFESFVKNRAKLNGNDNGERLTGLWASFPQQNRDRHIYFCSEQINLQKRVREPLENSDTCLQLRISSAMCKYTKAIHYSKQQHTTLSITAAS
jgi:hypothetical protein